MGRKAKDLTGKRFGKLTVIKRVENRVYRNGYETPQWLCKCDCGNDVVVIGKNLTKKNGATKSCGCFARENMSKVKKKYNTYDLSGEYGIGYTSKGEEFYFDLEDYDLIKDYCWYIHKSGYVYCSLSDHKTIKMHRLVMDCDNDLMPDHIHGKYTRMDNRKSNLRLVTHSQNMMNRKLNNNKSGTTGVFWDKNQDKWTAYITANKVRHHLGSFDTFEEAKIIRKNAEEVYHGEYSYDNSVGDLYE